MKIVILGEKTHENIIGRMLTEDFIANPEVANVSLRALGLQIKSVNIENNETVVYVENYQNLLLG